MLNGVTRLAKSQFTIPWKLMDLPRVNEVTVTEVVKSPETIIIKLNFRGRDSSMVLEVASNTIWFMHGAWKDLTGECTFATDELDTLLLSVPGIIVNAPLLVANSIFWKVNSKLFGMKRHALSIWCRVRHQLDPEAQEQLFQALIRL